MLEAAKRVAPLFIFFITVPSSVMLFLTLGAAANGSGFFNFWIQLLLLIVLAFIGCVSLSYQYHKAED